MSSELFPLSVESAVERARERNPEYGALLSTRFSEALAESKIRAAESPRSPLHNVPFTLKDEWETKLLPTTGGSHRHRNRTAPVDSTVFQAFHDAGAVLLGKSNLSDMALAPETSNYLRGPARNPFDPSRTAGGSSGGAALSVALGISAFDWGTDIGGSIRLPAAYCDVLGLRLSSETWPIRSGSFPAIPAAFGWLCGQGPLTQTVPQMRAVLEAARDRLRVGPSRPFTATHFQLYLPHTPGKWPTFADDASKALQAAFGSRYPVRAAELPTTDEVRNAYAAVWCSHLEDLVEGDPSLTLARGILAALSGALFRGRLGRDFYPDTAELLLLVGVGRISLYRDRKKALADATAIRDRFERAWGKGAIVVAPVSTFPPPLLGRSRFYRNHNLTSCTMPGNIADATALSIPFGRFADGLPRALQLMGPPGSEDDVLRLAEELQTSMRRKSDTA